MDDRLETRQETSLRDFVDVVFRRKWIIISVLAVALVLIVFLDARQPKIWESSSRVLVRRGEQTSILNQQLRTLGWEEEVASEIQVILSDDVFSRARAMFADSIRARGMPEDWKFNPGSVRADVMGESNVFVIRYVDTRKEVCRIGCDAVTLAFRDYYRERKAPPKLSDFFADELSDVRAELETWRTKRNEFQNKERFYGADETSKFLLNQIGALDQRASQLNGDVSSQQLRVANLESLVKKSGPELESELAFSMTQHVLQSGIVQNIKFSLQRLNMEKEELSQKYTDKHPDVIAVNTQIAQLHDDLKREVENALQVERVSLSEMEARRAGTLSELTGLRKQLDLVPDREKQLAEMDEMIETLQRKHELLLNRQSEAEISRAGSPEWDVSILSFAGTPTSKKTRDYVRLALGPLLSLIVGLGIAFFLESMDHSVKNRAEAEEFLDMPVLAVISDTSAEGRRAAGG